MTSEQNRLVKKFQDENGRLRAALTMVMTYDPMAPDWRIHAGMRLIAQSALEGATLTEAEAEAEAIADRKSHP